MVKEAEAVCGRSKGPPRHTETCWWNDEIGKRWRESGVCFYRQRIVNHGKRKRMRRLIGKLISKSRGSYIKQRMIIARIFRGVGKRESEEKLIWYCEEDGQ